MSEDFGIFTLGEEEALYNLLRKVAENNHFLPSQRTFEAFHNANGSKTAVEVLVEKDGKAFLVHRVDQHWNGWHIPGGYVQWNTESIEDACNKVAKREFNCSVRLVRIRDVYKWRPGEHPYGFPTSIVCVCESLGEIQETKDARFFDHVPGEFVAPCHRRFVENYFSSAR